MKEPSVLELESERELVEQARQGERYAMSRLLALHRQRAVRIAYGMLRSAEDAEDVAQEAFIRVFRSLSTFRDEAKFSTWLYRIIINLCASRRRSPASREIATDFSVELPTEKSSVESIDVWTVLEKLPARQRAVLILGEMEQLPYAEIAEVLGIAVGTVKFHVSEARRNFRRIWLEEMGDEM